jgi:serine/threonine protein phosphatase PrpC
MRRRNEDPFQIKTINTHEDVIYVFRQITFSGQKVDYIDHYKDECFAVAKGNQDLPNADLGSRLAAETALWGYRQIRLRPFYWQDKKLLLNRIFRSVNMTLWQKRRETGFTKGVESTLGVVIFGPHKVWLGAMGDCPIYIFRNGQIVDELSSKLNIHKFNCLGRDRYGIVPQVAVFKFEANDVLCLFSGNISQNINISDLAKMTLDFNNTEISLGIIADKIIDAVKFQNLSKELSVYLIRRANK